MKKFLIGLGFCLTLFGAYYLFKEKSKEKIELNKKEVVYKLIYKHDQKENQRISPIKQNQRGWRAFKLPEQVNLPGSLALNLNHLIEKLASEKIIYLLDTLGQEEKTTLDDLLKREAYETYEKAYLLATRTSKNKTDLGLIELKSKPKLVEIVKKLESNPTPLTFNQVQSWIENWSFPPNAIIESYAKTLAKQLETEKKAVKALIYLLKNASRHIAYFPDSTQDYVKVVFHPYGSYIDKDWQKSMNTPFLFIEREPWTDRGKIVFLFKPMRIEKEIRVSMLPEFWVGAEPVIMKNKIFIETYATQKPIVLLAKHKDDLSIENVEIVRNFSPLSPQPKKPGLYSILFLNDKSWSLYWIKKEADKVEQISQPSQARVDFHKTNLQQKAEFEAESSPIKLSKSRNLEAVLEDFISNELYLIDTLGVKKKTSIEELLKQQAKSSYEKVYLLGSGKEGLYLKELSSKPRLMHVIKQIEQEKVNAETDSLMAEFYFPNKLIKQLVKALYFDYRNYLKLSQQSLISLKELILKPALLSLLKATCREMAFFYPQDSSQVAVIFHPYGSFADEDKASPCPILFIDRDRTTDEVKIVGVWKGTVIEKPFKPIKLKDPLIDAYYSLQGSELIIEKCGKREAFGLLAYQKKESNKLAHLWLLSELDIFSFRNKPKGFYWFILFNDLRYNIYAFFNESNSKVGKVKELSFYDMAIYYSYLE